MVIQKKSQKLELKRVREMGTNCTQKEKWQNKKERVRERRKKKLTQNGSKNRQQL